MGRRVVPDREGKVPGSRVPDKDGGGDAGGGKCRMVPSRGGKRGF